MNDSETDSPRPGSNSAATPPASSEGTAGSPPHRRRPRYAGKYPRRFEDKYKEHDPSHHAETIAKVVASGKTPAGSHRPIMVDEVLKVLAPVPGDAAVDCTLGYGGHASAILNQILPGGRLLGVDADPIELPKAEGRLREKGFGPDVLQVVRSNFAGLPQAMQQAGFPSANVLLADLGVSSMQLDDPIRGFTTKFAGPLDMRMNPGHGQPASRFLERVSAAALTDIFSENADEPRAGRLAEKLAGKRFVTTTELTAAVRAMLPELDDERREMTVRRVFQALRIAVNEEFSALEALLRNLPVLLAPGGRVAILSFHSGEDRRVKKCFAAGRGTGIFAAISEEVVRPSAAEQQSNPRSTAAKLRWALRATS